MKMYFYHHYHSGRWWLLYPSRDAAKLLTEGDNHLMYAQAVMRPIAITSNTVHLQYDTVDFNDVDQPASLEYCRNCSPDLLALLLGDARK